MSRAAVAITVNGLKLAQTIKNSWECDIFILRKYQDGSGATAFDCSMGELLGKLFQEYRQIVLIMSCGIAVRSIAPLLGSKLTDPAVVVADEQGRHVISLLSGHIGGANRLARELAAITGGTAVITTASDNQELEAVDMLAERLGCVIEDYRAAKLVTACLVNGGKVGIVFDAAPAESRFQGMCIASPEEAEHGGFDGVVYVGHKEKPLGRELEIPVCRLIKRDLVLGLGCRRGTEYSRLYSLVKRVFTESNLSLKAVKALATIDLKADEPCMRKLAEELGARLVIIDRRELAEVEGLFESSEFVRQTTGIGCVCEPAAYVASGRGECILPKKAAEGITISIYRVKDNPEEAYDR